MRWLGGALLPLDALAAAGAPDWAWAADTGGVRWLRVNRSPCGPLDARRPYDSTTDPRWPADPRSGDGQMMPGRRRARQARRVIHALIALSASAAVLGVLAFGYGTIPALGPALDPGHGVWTSAAAGDLPR